MEANFTTVKYNGKDAHNLDRFDTIDGAVMSARTLHDPSWPSWQGIWVIDNSTGKAVFDSGKD